MDTVQLVNVFSRTPEHAKAIAQVDLLEDQLDLLEDEQEKAENGLALIQRERVAAENPEDSDGFMGSLGSTFSTLTDPASWSALQDTLTNATNTIMMVMALFILRTLILPLLFLYCLGIVFKAIWRVDARELLMRYLPADKEPANA